MRESGFYLRLYSVEPGKEALRENDPLIDRFYTPPTATGSAVDHNSEDFQAVLEKLKDEYFREFKACIITLSLMIATPGFKPFFLESPTDKSFLARLWTAYRQLSAQVLRRAGEEERRAGWRVTWSRKMKMLISVVKLIYEAVVKVFNSDTLRMASANSSQDNFLESLIEQLEQDILTFESMELSSSVSCDSFTKLITELLLALFPFALYHRPTDLPRLERINRVLAGIRSEALAPI